MFVFAKVIPKTLLVPFFSGHGVHSVFLLLNWCPQADIAIDPFSNKLFIELLPCFVNVQYLWYKLIWHISISDYIEELVAFDFKRLP